MFSRYFSAILFKHLWGNYVGKLLPVAADRLNAESPGLSEPKPKYDFSPTKTTEAVKGNGSYLLSHCQETGNCFLII